MPNTQQFFVRHFLFKIDRLLPKRRNFSNLNLVHESTILTSHEKELLLSHKDVNSRKNWKLIYKASVDGDTGKDFYRKCSGISPILAVIKSKEKGQVFGGFSFLPFENPADTMSGGWRSDPLKRNWLYIVRCFNFHARFLTISAFGIRDRD